MSGPAAECRDAELARALSDEPLVRLYHGSPAGDCGPRSAMAHLGAGAARLAAQDPTTGVWGTTEYGCELSARLLALATDDCPSPLGWLGSHLTLAAVYALTPPTLLAVAEAATAWNAHTLSAHLRVAGERRLR